MTLQNHAASSLYKNDLDTLHILHLHVKEGSIVWLCVCFCFCLYAIILYCVFVFVFFVDFLLTRTVTAGYYFMLSFCWLFCFCLYVCHYPIQS